MEIILKWVFTVLQKSTIKPSILMILNMSRKNFQIAIKGIFINL